MLSMFHHLVAVVTFGPRLVLVHPGWTFVIGATTATIGAFVLTHRALSRAPEPGGKCQGAVLGSDGVLHAVWAGYDGEGVYAWSCQCGDGCSDFQGLDYATEEGTHHLIEAGAIVSA